MQFTLSDFNKLYGGKLEAEVTPKDLFSLFIALVRGEGIRNDKIETIYTKGSDPPSVIYSIKGHNGKSFQVSFSPLGFLEWHDFNSWD